MIKVIVLIFLCVYVCSMILERDEILFIYRTLRRMQLAFLLVSPKGIRQNEKFLFLSRLTNKIRQEVNGQLLARATE